MSNQDDDDEPGEPAQIEAFIKKTRYKIVQRFRALVERDGIEVPLAMKMALANHDITLCGLTFPQEIEDELKAGAKRLYGWVEK
jgi:hypothetical protein